MGAALGEASLGHRLGRKAAVFGGCLGTLPDLDVLIPLGNAVASFIYHRSFSHSLFVLGAITPLVVWWAARRYQASGISISHWILTVYGIFVTHVLLDCLTAYGTQIFWPFFTTPISWSSIFIVDPFYTVPLLIGLLCLLVAKRRRHFGHLANRVGLVISTLYLCASMVTKVHVEQRVAMEVEAQGVDATLTFTTPSPFNILLWRAVVMVEGGYYEVFYSVLDGAVPLRFNFYKSDRVALSQIEDSWSVRRLQWFSRGFYGVRSDSAGVVMSDLRMGIEPEYVFRFKVADVVGDKVVETNPVLLRPNRSLDDLGLIWRRIWDPSVALVR